MTPPIPQRVLDRLDERIDSSGGPDACWPWLRSVGSHGYGQIGWGDRGVNYMETAPRAVWIRAHGSIPDGLVLDHLCHTRDLDCPGGNQCAHRICCNLAHLEPVTQAENMRRGGNARKTHCPAGHPYEGDNVIWDGSGKRHRRCRTCRLERNKITGPERWARARARGWVRPSRRK